MEALWLIDISIWMFWIASPISLFSIYTMQPTLMSYLKQPSGFFCTSDEDFSLFRPSHATI
jgi:hypothetical protein